MSRFLIPMVVFALLIAIFVVGLGRDPSQLPSPLLEKPAPQFDLPSLLDPEQRVTTQDFNGEVALVNVWATWCAGCRQEHDFLMQLSKAGVLPIYGLNWRDNGPDARRWLQQLGDPYVATAYDQDGRVGIDWGVYGAPETFLIAADGTILYKQLGPLSWGLWEENFVPLLEGQEQLQ
ncbi:MAG: DsbE family thiol:disulfide interchange protein [Gammaproteobacteria bacterium]|nr:DsbE family thiol:disulfide interchange protein [Gammaproteobacteria bacterium]MDH3414972.1 DsbE family thiol:disulfide interchange protein [Gammaproteobacteria bacterium]